MVSTANGKATRKPATRKGKKPTAEQLAEKARKAELRAKLAEIESVEAYVANSKAEQERRQRMQDGFRSNAFAGMGERMYDRIIGKIEWHMEQVEMTLNIGRRGKSIDLPELAYDLMDAAALARLLYDAADTVR